MDASFLDINNYDVQVRNVGGHDRMFIAQERDLVDNPSSRARLYEFGLSGVCHYSELNLMC